MPRIGIRKMYYLLEKELPVGRDKLFRILRANHLLIRSKKNYTKTTMSKHWLHKHPNLLKTTKITRPQQVYVSDITYVKSREKTHYLSLITDAYSRKIVGFHLSDDLNAESIVNVNSGSIVEFFNAYLYYSFGRASCKILCVTL